MRERHLRAFHLRQRPVEIREVQPMHVRTCLTLNNNFNDNFYVLNPDVYMGSNFVRQFRFELELQDVRLLTRDTVSLVTKLNV